MHLYDDTHGKHSLDVHSPKFLLIPHCFSLAFGAITFEILRGAEWNSWNLHNMWKVHIISTFFPESVFLILSPIMNSQQTYFKYKICQHAQCQCFLTCFYHQRKVANVLSIYNKHDHNIYLSLVNKDALFVHFGRLKNNNLCSSSLHENQTQVYTEIYELMFILKVSIFTHKYYNGYHKRMWNGFR